MSDQTQTEILWGWESMGAALGRSREWVRLRSQPGGIFADLVRRQGAHPFALRSALIARLLETGAEIGAEPRPGQKAPAKRSARTQSSARS